MGSGVSTSWLPSEPGTAALCPGGATRTEAPLAPHAPPSAERFDNAARSRERVRRFMGPDSEVNKNPVLPGGAACVSLAAVAGPLVRSLVGDPGLTSAEVADQAGVDLDWARRLWRALGFPPVPDDERLFSRADVAMLQHLRNRPPRRDVVRAADARAMTSPPAEEGASPPPVTHRTGTYRGIRGSPRPLAAALRWSGRTRCIRRTDQGGWPGSSGWPSRFPAGR